MYRSGESFQSSCKYQCTCLDGAVGCVPLCSMDVRLPSPDCPFPRRVKLPGKCCEEWVCDEPKDRTVVGPALAGEFSSSKILPHLRAQAQVHQVKGKIVLSGCFTLCLCVLLSQPTDWKTHLAQTQL